MMNKQYAILFKSKKSFNEEDETVVSYIPWKVIEGTQYYTRFVDSHGNGYTHMTEEYDDPVSFGFPQTESSLLFNYSGKSISEIKEILLSQAKNYQYHRNYMYNDVYMMKKGETEGYILQDNYTQLLNQIRMLDNNISDNQDDDLEEFTYRTYKTLAGEKNASSISSSISHEKLYLPLDIQKMYEYVSSRIIGQDEPIKKIISALYENYTSDQSRNLFITGPSGVGKTKTLQLLSEIMEIPLSIIDVSSFTSSGYKGSSVEDILPIIYHNAKKDLKLAENSIVVLDEIDKKAIGSTTLENDISKKAVLDELLGYLSGNTYTFQTGLLSSVTLNTSNITFVSLGACEGIQVEKSIGFMKKENAQPKITNQDYLRYGFTKEFLRRSPIKIRMNSLGYQELKNILLHSELSALKRKIKYYKAHFQVDLILKEELIDDIVRKSLQLDLGASSLDETIESLLDGNIVFDLAMQKEKVKGKRLILTKETMNNPKKYILM